MSSDGQFAWGLETTLHLPTVFKIGLSMVDRRIPRELVLAFPRARVYAESSSEPKRILFHMVLERAGYWRKAVRERRQ